MDKHTAGLCKHCYKESNTLFSNRTEQHTFIHDLGMRNLHFIDEKTQYCNFQVKKLVLSSVKSDFCTLPDGLYIYVPMPAVDH